MNYPVLLDLHNKQCLIVGGGSVALRKATKLLEAGAEVLVISREFHPDLSRLTRTWPRLKLRKGEFRNRYLRNRFLVIAATDDKDLNKRICALADKRQIPVNSVNTRQHTSFMNMAVVEKDDILIALSTKGRNTEIIGKLKQSLEEWDP